MERPTKRCARCGERMNPNAFPRGSSFCYSCQDKQKGTSRSAKTTPTTKTEQPMQLNQAQFAVVDTETTGLDVGGRDQLVEIAAVGVAVLGANNSVVSSDHYQTYVNPSRKIPATASAIHHITHEETDAAPRPAEAVAALRMNYNDHAFVAHNAAFDSAALGLTDRPWLCTQRLARHLWPDAPSHSNQVLRYWLKTDPAPPPGLHPHRALYDAICTAELLRRELREVSQRWPDLETVEQLIAKASQPALLNTVSFGKHRGRKWADMDAGFLQWILDKGFDDADVRHTARHYLNGSK